MTCDFEKQQDGKVCMDFYDDDVYRCLDNNLELRVSWRIIENLSKQNV